MAASEDIVFPRPVCIEAGPHAPHRIEGTWRTGCPGRPVVADEPDDPMPCGCGEDEQCADDYRCIVHGHCQDCGECGCADGECGDA